MCLIALAWRTHPRYELALIANRDEFHARPAAAAGADPAHPDVHGGRDLVQGGSWLQVSTRGRLAAVTNVRAGAPDGAARRSRGALVRDFAAGTSTAAEFTAGLAATAADYGRFNLLVWDGGELRFAGNHPGFVTHAVSPGVHAMSNGAFDARWPKSTRATAALASWLGLHARGMHTGDAPPSLAPLFEALADTTPAPDALLPDTGVGMDLERALSPPFVRGTRYGTRCSSVVLVAADTITFVERRFGPDAAPAGEGTVILPRAG